MTITSYRKSSSQTSSSSTFAGLRIAVTGGTSGLGLALVEAFHRQGADVAFIARNAERVREVARSMPGTHGIEGDVSKKEQIHPLALQITAALGGLDILIHNASTLGPVPLALLADTECEDFEEALETNLLGPFRLTKALLGALTSASREGGKAIIVHVSSDAAIEPYAKWGAYGASKAALSQLGRIWNEELREFNVRVEEFEPGDMDTPLHALALPGTDPATLKHPSTSAAVLVARLAKLLREEVAA